MDYAKEAALYTTKGGLGELVFAPNYKGENDVAIFDFTGMMYSDNASKILERKGKRLLLGIAGDSLFEVSCWCLPLYREILCHFISRILRILLSYEINICEILQCHAFYVAHVSFAKIFFAKLLKLPFFVKI